MPHTKPNQTTVRELVHFMTETTTLNEHQARQAVLALREVIKTELRAGRSVRLTGFGEFAPYEKQARNHYDPNTGKRRRIPARNHVRFRPSSAFLRGLRE